MYLNQEGEKMSRLKEVGAVRGQKLSRLKEVGAVRGHKVGRVKEMGAVRQLPCKSRQGWDEKEVSSHSYRDVQGSCEAVHAVASCCGNGWVDVWEVCTTVANPHTARTVQLTAHMCQQLHTARTVQHMHNTHQPTHCILTEGICICIA